MPCASTMVDQVKAKTEEVRMELELKENDRSEQKEMKSGTKRMGLSVDSGAERLDRMEASRMR
jgi:phosphosulfolactate synthase (CoM biosynthesis protein A)